MGGRDLGEAARVDRAALGRWGEELAARQLEASGARVLARNWRCRLGELDLVVQEPDGTVVVVEVKTRSGTGFGLPAEAVGTAKARRLRTLARAWLAEARPSGAPDVRFDVVAVLKRPGWAPQVEHLRGVL